MVWVSVWVSGWVGELVSGWVGVYKMYPIFNSMYSWLHLIIMAPVNQLRSVLFIDCSAIRT